MQYSFKKPDFGDDISNRVESLSINSMQERIKNDTSYVIYIEGLNQLAKIEIRKNNITYKTLDLS